MVDETSVEFNGVQYTKQSLATLDQEQLLSLRNLVANNLGVATIKGFKDLDQAKDATWKALLKFDQTEDSELAGNGDTKATKKEKAPKEPKEPRVVKGALPGQVKRPTRDMFHKIEKLKDPERVKERWDNYKDGMTILETIEGDNMTPLDISFYVKEGYVKLHEPTEEEFEAGVAAWYERNGLENPTAAKKAAAEEKAKAKAEREAQKEAEAKARAEAKAAKEQERADAKAQREAEKQAKAQAKAAEQPAS